VTHKFSISGHEGYITVGLYDDGRPGEMFVTMAKEGSTIGGLMDCFGTAVSMSLQYGVPLEVYVNKFSHTRFEPMGHTKNPDIRIAKSIVDYIFRWMGIQFLPGYKEAMLGKVGGDEPAPKSAGDDAETETKLAAKKVGEQKPGAGSPAAKAAPAKVEPPKVESAKPAATRPVVELAKPANGAAKTKSNADLLQRAGVMQVDLNGGQYACREDQFASFQTDAPSCDNCGAITVRNGNCYLCHNCGNSMGCS
jgi:ribonucleoside-diphosphate reductase alpha chain